MRRKLMPLGVVLVALFLFACTKEGTEPSTRKFISFKLDGVPYATELHSGTLFLPTSPDPLYNFSALYATALNDHGARAIISLKSEEAELKPGVYTSTKAGNSLSITLPFEGNDYLADDQTGDMTFQIYAKRDSVIEGSFAGTVTDAFGIPRTVSNGAFRIVYTSY
ncbi:hypothetical protein MKQ68_24400 [Chitinophaga horti]|uniref:DUF1735 domain-containing protein n=1 Tax=Chitinophaga horti TaxID=2920382 RepID=A0ABY6J0N7_9BACT|nr:hypothetical protein [Chitinophaga horti]UYQ93228.1 hypothetical protein MKQ68_24400 [Chitinophaga horti]